MTSAITPESVYKAELARQCGPEKLRSDCLSAAVLAVHDLPLPPMTICPHRHHDECDCPLPTRDQVDGHFRCNEDVIVARTIRVAEQFMDWVSAGITPEMTANAEMDAGLAAITRPDNTD